MSKVTAILDLKGIVMHAYHGAMAAEPIYGTLKEKINTAECGFATFLNMYYDGIIDVVDSPINVIACLDDGSIYRKSLYPDYKANRKKVDHDPLEVVELDKCQALVKNFLASQGVVLVKLANTEADDIIAYLVENLQGEKVVYTMDKDIIALGDKATIMYRNLPTEVLKCAASSPHVDVPPSCITLFKSLTGDSSDGYPGVKGFGPKAWDTLVAEFGNDGMEELDALMRQGDSRTIKAIALQVTNKALKKAADNYDDWKLMYRLAKLSPELCTGAKVKLEWFKRAPTLERLTSVMNQAGCPDLIAKYSRDVYRAILVTEGNLSQCLTEIEALTPETPFVAWDYETYDPVKNPNFKVASNGRDYISMLDSKIAGCSFAVGRNANIVYYVSVRHKDTANVPESWVLNLIKHFEEEGVEMVAQNINFEATITKNVFSHTLKHWTDTKLFSHHVDENSENGLKFLSKAYLNYNQTSYAATLAAADAKDMSEISGQQVLLYGCDDSLVTGHLYSLFTFMTQLEGTYNFIQQYECPAVAPLVDAHIGGIKVDLEELSRQKTQDEATVKDKMQVIRDALAENCSELNLEAVERLYADQRDYESYKAKQAFTSKNAAAGIGALSDYASDALKNYKLRLKAGAFYQPLVERREFKEFIPTPKVLTDITKKLGLPEITKVSRIALSDWLPSVRAGLVEATPEQSKFLDLLGPAVSEFTKREGNAYDKLADFCNVLLEKDAKVVMEGTELNMGSPIQNAHLFYLLLDLPIRNRTKVQKGSMRDKGGFVGSPATDESAVQFALANDCVGSPWKAQLLKDLLEYKAAATRLSIYWNPYPLWLDTDQVMHPGFNSCGTVTRRPTGGNPNLLQVSKGDVRKVFIPKSADNVIVSVDFSSEELRVLASVSKDPTFMSAYTGEHDLDLHALTACGLVPMFLARHPEIDKADILFDCETQVNYDWFKEHQDDATPMGKFLKECRNMAKVANFGAGYGAGPSTLSLQLMIPLEDGGIIVEAMAKTYPGIQTWKDGVYKEAKTAGSVETTYRSKRHCGNGLSAGSRSEITRWERQLANFLIQGQCADLLKVALAEMDKNGTLAKHRARLIAPIYDELLFEVPKDTLHAFLQDICDDMEQPMPGIDIPMVADCSFGPNWGKQYEVGNRPSLEKIQEALAKL